MNKRVRNFILRTLSIVGVYDRRMFDEVNKYHPALKKYEDIVSDGLYYKLAKKHLESGNSLMYVKKSFLNDDLVNIAIDNSRNVEVVFAELFDLGYKINKDVEYTMYKSHPHLIQYNNVFYTALDKLIDTSIRTNLSVNVTNIVDLLIKNFDEEYLKELLIDGTIPANVLMNIYEEYVPSTNNF